jgi:hypothetical protein
MIYADTSMHTLFTQLKTEANALLPEESLTFDVPDPDLCSGCYAGETFDYAGEAYRHHGWHSWSTLAHLLGCRMLTPKLSSPPWVTVRFQKLDPNHSFHTESSTEDKYHPHRTFARIEKSEEPDFLYHYLQALDEVKIAERKRILDLGIHRADEFAAIDAVMGENHGMDMVGVDWSDAAIDMARTRIPHATFHAHDINDLNHLGLGHFDLLITIGTLQSPGIETKPLIMDLVQNYLDDDGALIFGFPNTRWVDGEMLPGAKAPNYPFSELSLLIKDIHWIKKYLQQHRYRVRIFGQSYLFLVATRISASKA